MIYDVTVPMTNMMPVWPSDPPVSFTPKSHLSRNQSHIVRLTAIAMGSHTGTHVDAPYHFIEDGRKLHEIPLEEFVGRATVFEVKHVSSIGLRDLTRLEWDGVERVLFKTDNSEHWQDGRFYQDFVYLEPEGADFLADRGIRLVGIDYLSVDRFKSEEHPAHFILLTRNIVILEGLNLANVPPGRYSLTALPLNLQDVDGAPVRAILMDE